MIHFGGFELNKTHSQVIHLGNISTEVQRMHIIPPQTKFFYIKYKKSVSKMNDKRVCKKFSSLK